jgi:hypothetical protein
MEPPLSSGDRVLIDTSQRVPVPPGIFAIWDGLGLVAKRIEHEPNSDPAMVVIKSANPNTRPMSAWPSSPLRLMLPLMVQFSAGGTSGFAGVWTNYSRKGARTLAICRAISRSSGTHNSFPQIIARTHMSW